MPTTIDRSRLDDLFSRELDRFQRDHPRSRELFERARETLLAGVPMPWMSEWAGPYPVFVAEAHGGEVRMMASGRGGARGAQSVDRLEQSALDAAVRGALRGVGRELVTRR